MIPKFGLRKKYTGNQIRSKLMQIDRGKAHKKILIKLRVSRPRKFHSAANLESLMPESGIYIIYAYRKYRSVNLGASRIQYIGRGWIGDRLSAKRKEKRRLVLLSNRKSLKFIWVKLQDESMEFVLESILLREHKKMFSKTPAYNQRSGSSAVKSWRKLLKFTPGVRQLLNRFG